MYGRLQGVEAMLNLINGLRIKIGIKKNFFMLDFRHNEQRYRPVTIFEATEDNQPKAENILNKIKKDLSKNSFYLSNYEKHFKTPEILAPLDADFKKEKISVLINTLILKELDEYKKRVAVGTLGIATYENYIYAANLHTLPYFSNYQVSEVNGEVLENFIRKLPFTKKRIELIFRPLRKAFRKALKSGLINFNPIYDIDEDIYLTVVQDSNYEVNPFNLDEIDAILQNCTHDVIRNFIKFGFWTGMRIGEIFALEWSDISFTNEIISITKSATIRGIIKEPKTEAGIRIVEMTTQAKEALLSQFEITGKENGRVFLTPLGRPWKKTSAFREYWKSALTLAGVEYRNPYQMRHTFISYMLSIGNNPMVLYQMVGHKKPKIMFEKYARFIKQNDDKKLLFTTPK